MNVHDDDSLIRDFRLEASERLANIDGALLQLEMRDTDPETLIHRLFRDVHAIKGAAATLGFASLTRVTHQLEDVLMHLRDKQLTCDQNILDALFAGIDVVRDGLGKPNNEPFDVNAVCERLARRQPSDFPPRAAEAPKSDHQNSITVVPKKNDVLAGRGEVAQPDAETETRQKKQLPLSATSSTGSNDKSLYMVSVLRSVNMALTDAEKSFFGQIARVAATVREESMQTEFANELLDVLRGHDFFRRVDRICLAKVIANSNQMMVVTSAARDKHAVNVMPVGYTCYVNPNGSLFQLKDGYYRVYGDSQKVVDSFTSAGLPPQRSIQYILSMGFRSGVCLPIYVGAKPSGFFFLNSTRVDAFQRIPERALPLMVSIAVLAKAALLVEQTAFGVPRRTGPESISKHCGTPFDVDTFRKLLGQMIHSHFGLSKPIQINLQAPGNFLYTPAHFSTILLRLLAALGHLSQDNALQIAISVQGQEVTTRLPHWDAELSLIERTKLQSLLQIVDIEAKTMGIRTTVDEDVVTVRFPYDPFECSAPNVGYSIARNFGT